MSLQIAPREEPQEHWKLDGWRMHIEQCATLHEVVGADFDIRRRVGWAAKRGVPTPWAPAALALCEQRRREIAAQAEMRPGASGGESQRETETCR